MGGVFVYNGIATEREFQRLIAEGDRASAAGQGFVAIEAYSGALALNSDSMAVYLKRGEVYHAHGDHETARRDLLMAARLDPSATRPLERLGDVSMALDAFETAVEHYGEFVRLDDQNPHVLYKLAVARQRSGRIARAVPLLRQAIALDGSLAEAHYVLGLCLREQGRLEEAGDVLEQAIELSPGLLPAREALAGVHRLQGDQRGELQQLDALAALDGSNPRRHIARALAHARAGRSQLALLALREASERHPDRPEVFAALGQVWLETAERGGDGVALGQALAALRSIPASSATSQALTLLGRALHLNGDTDEARRILRLALSRYPIAPAALLQLATLESEAHNRDVADRLRRRYRSLTERSDQPPAPTG